MYNTSFEERGMPMRIQEVEWNIHRYESYIAQLEGIPGSIPEAAGKEYVAWVESLRVICAPVV